MNEKEIAEIRRRFRPDKTNISKIRGCYVNESHEIISEFYESLGLLAPEQTEDILSRLKKTLSGTVGKNLVDMEFSTQQVLESEEHKLLSTLRKTSLSDDATVKEFYEKVRTSLTIEGAYLILLASDTYDVPSYSKDGEEGFPANLAVKITYKLEGASLLIDYEARPDGKTPIALTNHAYFNLDGFGGTIEEHVAKIYANQYTEVDESLIPNGIRPNVEGTPFDFKTEHTIGERCGEDFIGYDHNFILAPEKYETLFGKKLGLAAEVKGKKLGMKVYTDQPGVQFYIGNFLGNGPDFRGNVKQVFHGAFCLETQTEPDCINHGIGFYDAGDVYTHSTVYAVEEL